MQLVSCQDPVCQQLQSWHETNVLYIRVLAPDVSPMLGVLQLRDCVLTTYEEFCYVAKATKVN